MQLWDNEGSSAQGTVTFCLQTAFKLRLEFNFAFLSQQLVFPVARAFVQLAQESSSLKPMHVAMHTFTLDMRSCSICSSAVWVPLGQTTLHCWAVALIYA